MLLHFYIILLYLFFLGLGLYLLKESPAYWRIYYTCTLTICIIFAVYVTIMHWEDLFSIYIQSLNLFQQYYLLAERHYYIKVLHLKILFYGPFLKWQSYFCAKILRILFKYRDEIRTCYRTVWISYRLVETFIRVVWIAWGKLLDFIAEKLGF